MEQITLADNAAPTVCANCNSSMVLPGYPTALCSDCREKFIKFPIPNWIKAFGIGVAAVLCYALFSLPTQLSVGIHLKKGEKAADDHRYRTAQRELEKVLQKVPNSQEAQAYLLISSFHNYDFTSFQKMLNKLRPQTFDDQEMLGRVETVLQDASDYFPSDTLQALINEYDGQIDSVPDNRLAEYIQRNPAEIFASFNMAQRFAGRDENSKADSVLTKILQMEKNYVPAQQMICGIKRQLGDMEGSIKYCDQVIANNKENVFVLSSKARTLLKLKKDKEALELAKNTYDIDRKDGYSQATLCLAYHFNGKQKERDELIQHAKNDSTLSYYFEYALDVINKKEPFR